MDKNFEHRLERAQNPRSRKHNGKRTQTFVRPSSHVAAVVNEVLGAMTDGGGKIYDPNPHQMGRNLIDAASAPIVAVHHLAVAAAMDGMEKIKEQLGKGERMKKLEKRRKYYATDAKRRERQREMLRAAAQNVSCACPTPEELTEAYLRRRENEDWQLRFGMLMIDLEEHARRTYAITGNKFTGSSGGVKDWLAKYCPLLAEHYATCQRYKRLAQDYST